MSKPIPAFLLCSTALALSGPYIGVWFLVPSLFIGVSELYSNARKPDPRAVAVLLAVAVGMLSWDCRLMGWLT